MQESNVEAFFKQNEQMLEQKLKEIVGGKKPQNKIGAMRSSKSGSMDEPSQSAKIKEILGTIKLSLIQRTR